VSSPGRYSNHSSSTTWLRATADDEQRADPMPALVWIARDAHAGCALLTPLTADADICPACRNTGLRTIFNYDGYGSDADDQPCHLCDEG
jgi:hypothetical protein